MKENITSATLLQQEHTALAAEITDAVNENLPREKALAEQQMAQTAEDIKQGLQPTSGDGRGQAVASIPPIIYMRWQLAYPGCWQDKGFVEEFLWDNPQCRLPGYKPRAKRLFFDMKHGNRKLENRGGDFYVENKHKIAAQIAESEKAFSG